MTRTFRRDGQRRWRLMPNCTGKAQSFYKRQRSKKCRQEARKDIEGQYLGMLEGYEDDRAEWQLQMEIDAQLDEQYGDLYPGDPYGDDNWWHDPYELRTFQRDDPYYEDDGTYDYELDSAWEPGDEFLYYGDDYGLSAGTIDGAIGSHLWQNKPENDVRNWEWNPI